MQGSRFCTQVPLVMQQQPQPSMQCSLLQQQPYTIAMLMASQPPAAMCDNQQTHLDAHVSLGVCMDHAKQ
jgi:ABC-type methionine transport system ATPase subunit